MDSRIREALESLRIAHIECDDGWYSCPKCDDGCLNPSEGAECNCGADEHNKRVDELIARLDAPVASGARELVKELHKIYFTDFCDHQQIALIESFAADRERKAREETARKCAEALRSWMLRGQAGGADRLEAAIMEAAHE